MDKIDGIDYPMGLGIELEQEALTEQQIKEIEHYNNAIYHTFTSDWGKQVAEFWFNDFVMKPVVIAGESLESHGIREGKAQIARHIKGIIALVESGYGRDQQVEAE